MTRGILVAIISLSAITSAAAQRGGQEWLNSNADAQRSSWIRTDAKISAKSLQKPGFQFLWKIKLDNEAKQLNSLAQPVILDRLIGYKGFKSLAFVGASSDTLYAIDYDLGRLYWKTRFTGAPASQSATVLCPGGLTAAATRPTSLLPPAQGRGGGGNRVSAARSLVGDPDQGFPDVFGRGAPVRGAAPAAPEPPARGNGGARGGGGGGGGGGQVGANSVFALAADGMLHQLSVQTGKDIVMQPLQVVPPNANTAGLILVDGVLYASTTNDCGGVPNGVWAADLGSPPKTVTSWKTNGPNIAGSAGPTVGSDGTVFVATGDAAGSGSNYANAVVALEPKTLKVKDYFTQDKADFSASPLVFQYQGRDLIAAAGKDGRIYLLSATSLGGSDHLKPLSVTSSTSNGDFAPVALATLLDANGTRWILAPASTAISAFKVIDRNGIPTLQPGWTSRDMMSPSTPIIVNDVVFALSTGEYRAGGTSLTAQQRAQRSKPSVLYALDASTA